MTSEPRLLATMRLDNGLELRFHDHSRKVAGDRWNVLLVATAAVEMDDSLLAGLMEDPSEFQLFREEAGPFLEYRQERQRIFVPEEDTEDVLRQVREELLRSQLAYLSRPDFRARYTRLRFSGWKEKKWLRDMMDRNRA